MGAKKTEQNAFYIKCCNDNRLGNGIVQVSRKVRILCHLIFLSESVLLSYKNIVIFFHKKKQSIDLRYTIQNIINHNKFL